MTIVVPGRANLIGEHVDYNDGLSLAFAVPYDVRVEVQPGGDVVQLEAEGFGSYRQGTDPAHEFERQAAAVFNELTPAPGTWRITSTLPAGAGLSSSAAYLGALVLASGARGSLIEMARLVQHVEHVAGSKVGLLDQLATLGAREGHLLLIDFHTLQYRDVLWPADLHLSAVDTGVRRQLATSAYSERREQCDAARATIGPWRDATDDDLRKIDDPVVRARARHVISEIQRVGAVNDALARSDVARVGELVDESHRSLSSDFDVSTPQIDDLVGRVRACAGVLGCRLMGGGFGGCLLVVHDGSFDEQPRFRQWALSAASGAFERLALAR